MRILVVIHEFPPVGGGGGHVARDICRGLAAKGHDIKVITAKLRSEEDKNLDPSYSVKRVPSWRRNPSRASLASMILFIVSAIIHCGLLIRNWKPDVIHAHFAVPAGPVAWILSKLTSIPYIITIHLGDIPGGTPQKTNKWFLFLKPFTYPIWNHAKKVVAVSEFSRDLARMNYQVPIDVIHNGIDISAIKPNTLKSHKPPRIVFAGRFVPQKQPLMIVDILSELSDQLWEAVMMGNGPQLIKVKETVLLRNLQDRISITGWVAPEEVIQEFTQSDILLMPSISEGLPIVGIQALASGLAFIVSNIGGFKYMVDDGSNGYLIPFEDKKIFIARLRLLLSDSDHLNYLRENSLKKASLFDSKRMVADYERILLSAIESE